VASSNWTYRKEYLAQLHKIAVQSAIVLGENSEITRDDELVSALPNARVVSVSGGHWIHYEQPERLAEVIDLLGKLGSS
jgi:pimeloyl-ACP methyl ester carboxylesterase